MNLMPEDLPDDPILVKQMLLEALSRQQVTAEAYHTHLVDLKEQIKSLRDRLFGRKSEQTIEPNTPQLALFNEPVSEPMPSIGFADEEVVAPTPPRGKRNPLSADLPRIEVIHELPEHELTCACGCRKHVISEEISEQLDICADADPCHQTYPQGLRLPWLRNGTGHRRQAGSTDRKEHGQSKRSGHAADHEVRRWLTAASFRNGSEPAW